MNYTIELYYYTIEWISFNVNLPLNVFTMLIIEITSFVFRIYTSLHYAEKWLETNNDNFE